MFWGAQRYPGKRCLVELYLPLYPVSRVSVYMYRIITSEITVNIHSIGKDCTLAVKLKIMRVLQCCHI